MAAEKKRAAPRAVASPASGAAGSAPRDDLPFEDAIERLETIVDELEGGALTLEESIARYEEGMKLSQHLSRALDEAERRIERLTEGAGGEPTTTPLEPEPRGGHPAERGAADAPGEGKLPF